MVANLFSKKVHQKQNTDSRFLFSFVPISSMSDVPSPCTNVCVLDGSICTGCGRTIEEVVNWAQLSDEQKKAVLARVAPSLLNEK